MAKTKPPLNYQERVALAIKERVEPLAQAIAAQLGPPSDAKNIPLEQELEWWNFRQTKMPDGTEVNPSQLLEAGVPFEKIVEVVFPMRQKMTNFGRPNPDDRVQYAQRMNRLSKKHGYPGYDDVEDSPEDEADSNGDNLGT